jgi:glycine cleavage system H lipoate-binding protein
MTAGILSYQLCDRSFDCDRCPLDAAMRKCQPRPAQPGGKARALGYSANHCWVERRREDTVRVGIEPRLAGALPMPRAIVLPTPGHEVRRGQSCVWIVLDEETFPVASPIDGEVSACHQHVADEPRLIGDPQAGWLFELRISANALEEAELLGKREAAARYAIDSARLSEALMEETSNPAVGATLADGGRPVQTAIDLIGAKRYIAILRRIFP